MRTKVTEQGVLVPKRLLQGVEEVEIREEEWLILIVPMGGCDPLFTIGKHPIDEASTNHDQHIYAGSGDERK